jgi:hypothetical protein
VPAPPAFVDLAPGCWPATSIALVARIIKAQTSAIRLM